MVSIQAKRKTAWGATAWEQVEHHSVGGKCLPLATCFSWVLILSYFVVYLFMIIVVIIIIIISIIKLLNLNPLVFSLYPSDSIRHPMGRSEQEAVWGFKLCYK